MIMFENETFQVSNELCEVSKEDCESTNNVKLEIVELSNEEKQIHLTYQFSDSNE